jgi:hypothetical protein
VTELGERFIGEASITSLNSSTAFVQADPTTTCTQKKALNVVHGTIGQFLLKKKLITTVTPRNEYKNQQDGFSHTATSSVSPVALAFEKAKQL